uniref:Uncharacterized protein n=1 Tax=Arundo donax TaxID=35708 RepID=A0A0A9FAN9_ARUDO
MVSSWWLCFVHHRYLLSAATTFLSYFDVFEARANFALYIIVLKS